jgi:hypothetical protein
MREFEIKSSIFTAFIVSKSAVSLLEFFDDVHSRDCRSASILRRFATLSNAGETVAERQKPPFWAAS